MTRRYQLQRLQKNILLSFSGAALASTMLLSNAQSPNQDILKTPRSSNTSIEVKTLNKAKKAKAKIHKKEKQKEFLEQKETCKK